MLIRTPSLVLERKRVPRGPVRANRDHPLYSKCLGLWLLSPSAMGVDLMGITPPLTFTASGITTRLEGPGLDAFTGATSSAQRTLAASSPLRVTTGYGLSIFVRWAPTETNPTQYGNVFGISYDDWATNPYVVSSIFRNSATDGFYGTNCAGSYNGVGPHEVCVSGQTRSNVLSHEFGVRTTGYMGGARQFTSTSPNAAPTYGTNPQVQIGSDVYNSRNAQAVVHICAVFGTALSADDAMDLEVNPYALVEPVNPFVWTNLPAPPPPPPPPPPPSDDGGGVLFGTLGGVQVPPRKRRNRKGYF